MSVFNVSVAVVTAGAVLMVRAQAPAKVSNGVLTNAHGMTLYTTDLDNWRTLVCACLPEKSSSRKLINAMHALIDKNNIQPIVDYLAKYYGVLPLPRLLLQRRDRIN